MTFGQRLQLAQRLRAIPLERVPPLCGGRPHAHDSHKWHTPAGTLSVTGPKFMNWNLGQGGGGAIDLVIHLRGLDFKAAVDWLAAHFASAPPAQPIAPRPPRPLRVPAPDPARLARVIDYLVLERGIAIHLLEPLIASGSVYADARTNAVFLLRDWQNLPVGAELRGASGQPWHGLAPGSKRDLGFFSIPPQPLADTTPATGHVILCESAIDAISCFALHPQHPCLSTAGARPNPLWLRPLLDQGCQVYCGFDADPTGEDMARSMIALHPAIKRLRPSQHDWNDALRAQA